MTEAEWSKKFKNAATDAGWKCCHVRPSMTRRGKWTTATSVAGWPDWFCYRPATSEHMFVELKTDIGVLSEEQNAVLSDLAESGCETHVWAPRDIHYVIARLTGVAP